MGGGCQCERDGEEGGESTCHRGAEKGERREGISSVCPCLRGESAGKATGKGELWPKLLVTDHLVLWAVFSHFRDWFWPIRHRLSSIDVIPAQSRTTQHCNDIASSCRSKVTCKGRGKSSTIDEVVGPGPNPVEAVPLTLKGL